MDIDVRTDIDVKSNVNDLISMIKKGQLLEAFEKYYADDVIMQENNEPPRIGKSANREYEQKFVSNVEVVHNTQIKNVAYNEEGNVVMIQYYMDFTLKSGDRVQMEQVAVQTWNNGKVIHEKFFYKI